MACAVVTGKLPALLSQPSWVSATTGSRNGTGTFSRMPRAQIASRTTPTEWVLVMQSGVASRPCSAIQAQPVISPLPLNE